jgi:hypothetical protein
MAGSWFHVKAFWIRGIRIQQAQFFIVSKISGSDKSHILFFSSNELATTYKRKVNSGPVWIQKHTSVNKDAKRLSLDKSTCLKYFKIYGLVSEIFKLDYETKL